MAFPSLSPALPPAPWDPVLLTGLHAAPTPNNFTGGGDWYMDTGAMAHMFAHPGVAPRTGVLWRVLMTNSEYEYVKREFEFDRHLPASNWIIVRFDGCHFHRFSKIHAFEKPNDECFKIDECLC
ncbi:probable tRNA(His) guanylyltransferase isoform X2 [Triticum aestivum]|uniref:probable tRNA(His) guanylyltransferase isoform X2 n=1 Tax=Triticum aestivum TaxID=4565 RepID=UPI001D0215F4|nr:probable tRNA(His) guanylyltransferase isoform X2 [Triticum aestivum]